MKSIQYFYLIILPVIAFSVIFTKNYRDVSFTCYKKNIDYVPKKIEIDEQIGDLKCMAINYPQSDNNHHKKQTQVDYLEEDEEFKVNSIKSNDKILNKEVEKNFPGARISVHPSNLSGGSESELSWLMTRPPHLVSTGQGQGY